MFFPNTANVQPSGRYVRGCGRLPRLHRVPGAVLPVLPDRRATLHTAAQAYHHDTCEYNCVIIVFRFFFRLCVRVF